MNEIILTSSVLILIIAALRRVLRGKIAPTLQYALWLLVAARLLIPGTLFTAPVTILGLADDIHSAVVESSKEYPAANETTPPIYVPDQNITIDPTPPSDSSGTNTTNPPSQITPSPAKPEIDWLDVIWKAGILTAGAVFLLSNLSFYRKLRRSRQRISEDDLPIACPIPVYYVPNLDAPCLFARAIYVNQAAMHPERLRHVITHELTHRRHGDHLWALLRCVCLSVHWYNPLVWWAAILSRRDCELSCDSAAIRTLGSTCDISYGETLMTMLTKSPAGLLRTATTMSASKRTMAERLHLIVHRPKMMKLTLAAVAFVTMGAVILTFGGCADEIDPPDTDSTITDNTEDDTSKSDDQTTDDGKLTPPDDGFGYIPSPIYTHPSGLFTMKLPDDCTVVTIESEDGVSFYDPEVYQSGSTDGWILSVQPQPADWNGNQNPTLTLAAFDPNSTPQVYVLEYSEAYGEQFTNLRDWISESFTLFATPELFSKLVHDNYKENLALAITYLPYLSWSNYKEVYGEDAMMELLSTLWQFADAGNADWGQYHDLLSMTNDGLDGAYSEGLASVFEALFIRNYEQFLSVINSIYITDTERARVSTYVDYAPSIAPDDNGGEDDDSNAPDDSGTDNSDPDDGQNNQQITAEDAQVILGLARGYCPAASSVAYSAPLVLTLSDDWTLEGIKAAVFNALADSLVGTTLEGDLRSITIAYSFRFPDEMRDGVTLTVPYSASFVDRDVHILPSGATHSPSCTVGELTATIHLVSEGVTGPVGEEFARGQELYRLFEQLVTLEDGIVVSRQDTDFQLLNHIRLVVEQRIADAGLAGQVHIPTMSSGQHRDPIWCEPGFEQTAEYSLDLEYTEGEELYSFTFRCTVTVKTVE